MVMVGQQAHYLCGQFTQLPLRLHFAHSNRRLACQGRRTAWNVGRCRQLADLDCAWPAAASDLPRPAPPCDRAQPSAATGSWPFSYRRFIVTSYSAPKPADSRPSAGSAGLWGLNGHCQTLSVAEGSVRFGEPHTPLPPRPNSSTSNELSDVSQDACAQPAATDAIEGRQASCSVLPAARQSGGGL